tara:strand:- start:1014 stop:1265 length:252 start_codon:yes stop_codon:yes gene_type:complete
MVRRMNRNVLYRNPHSFLRTLDTVEKVEEMDRLCKEHKKYLLNKERAKIDWGDEEAELFFLQNDKNFFCRTAVEKNKLPDNLN